MCDAETKYAIVIPALVANGCHAEFHRPGQLVVCKEERVLAGRIWITWRNQWFISTWAPTLYSVPDDSDVVALCVACVNHNCAGVRFYEIPDPIVQQFRLRRLDDRESDDLLDMFVPTDEL